MSRSKWRLILRAPVVHFLVIGGLLFALCPWGASRELGRSAEEKTSIALTEADVQRLCRDWEQQYGVLPSPAAAQTLLDQAIDEALLFREAFALGLNRNDRVVRTRLITLGRSLGLAPDADDSALEHEARALSLDRADEVLRRHLVHMMQLAEAKLGPSELPTETDLRQYYERHTDRFLDPARVRLTHVYLSLDRRRESPEEDAARLLDELRRGTVDPRDAPALGEPFVRGPHVPSATRSELERTFGPEFAGAMEALPTREWTGPVRSSYGLHLVWIHERVPPRLRPLDSVHNQVLHGWLRDRSEERFRTRMRALRDRYRIERPPLDLAECTKSG